MKKLKKYGGLTAPSPKQVWRPPLVVQHNIFGGEDYVPVTLKDKGSDLAGASFLRAVSKQKRGMKRYLGMRLIPLDWPTEGREEFPKLRPYEGSLPQGIAYWDESTPDQSRELGLAGFCYDDVLEQKCRNISNLDAKAAKFHCVFGPQFSVLMDGRRCDAVAAIRLNRLYTAHFQHIGLPTIQTVSLTGCEFFDIAFDGLASDCPVAVGSLLSLSDPHLKSLVRLNIEELLRRKSPTVLIVAGGRLPFDPGIPVVYYKSRIEKLRDNDYASERS